MITSLRENGIVMTGFLVFAVLPAAKVTSIDCRSLGDIIGEQYALDRGASGGEFFFFSFRFPDFGRSGGSVDKNHGLIGFVVCLHGIYRKTITNAWTALCVLYIIRR